MDVVFKPSWYKKWETWGMLVSEMQALFRKFTRHFTLHFSHTWKYNSSTFVERDRSNFEMKHNTNAQPFICKPFHHHLCILAVESCLQATFLQYLVKCTCGVQMYTISRYSRMKPTHSSGGMNAILYFVGLQEQTLYVDAKCGRPIRTLP